MSRAVDSALERLNALSSADAEVLLLSCCGSREWARRVAAERPFRSGEALAAVSDRVWKSLPKDAWLEAFAAHPSIGAGTGPADLHPPPNSKKGTDLFSRETGLNPSPHSSQERRESKIDLSPFSREEQSGVEGASPETLASLADINRDYEERFGWIFIVCATGKTAAEMLALARARIHNDLQTELAIAAEEQRKITRLRLAKLLEMEEA